MGAISHPVGEGGARSPRDPGTCRDGKARPSRRARTWDAVVVPLVVLASLAVSVALAALIHLADAAMDGVI